MAAIDYESTLSPGMLHKAQEELGEDEQKRTDSVLALREWAKEQPHLQAMPTGRSFFNISLLAYYYLF